MHELIAYFSNNRLELTATIFGFVCVLLNIFRNLWAWPTGIVSVAIYIYIFYHAGLYGDAGLSVFYVASGFYGWYNWLYGGENSQVLMVSRSPRRERWVLGGISAVGTLGMGFALSKTDDPYPYWDATTTVVSLVAQWMLTQKRLENWLLWIFVDIIAVGVYYAKELYITSFLYAAYLILATIGYFAWKKIANKQITA